MVYLNYLLTSFPGESDPLITFSTEDGTIDPPYTSVYIDEQGNQTVKVNDLAPQLLEELLVQAEGLEDYPRTFYLIEMGPSKQKGLDSRLRVDGSRLSNEKDISYIDVWANVDREDCVEVNERLVSGYYPSLYAWNNSSKGCMHGIEVPSLHRLEIVYLYNDDLRTIAACERIECLEIASIFGRLPIDAKVSVEIDTLRCSLEVFADLCGILDFGKIRRVELSAGLTESCPRAFNVLYPILMGVPVLAMRDSLLYYIHSRDRSMDLIEHPHLEITTANVSQFGMKAYSNYIDFYEGKYNCVTTRDDRLNQFEPEIELRDKVSFLELTFNKLHEFKSVVKAPTTEGSGDEDKEAEVYCLKGRHVQTKGSLKKVVCLHPRGRVTIDFDPYVNAKSAKSMVR
uniref:Uncharacterized protein n=1 Tax=viral metagenome TaxID=1070528 RepID=A0A6C0JTE3_9ZZZZ